MMFVCLSVTARKGTTFLNLLFVASPFGLKPVSSTDKRSKKSQQNSKLETKLSLSPRYLLSSNSAEEWYMVETANPQLTSEWIKDDLMKITFTFSQIISSDWFVRKQTKRNVKKPPSSNLPQAPPTWLSPPSSSLLACKMASGRGDLHSKVVLGW